MSTPFTPPGFTDFVVRVQRSGDHYHTLVVESPDGEGSANFASAPFGEAFAALLVDASQTSAALEAAVQELGVGLFDTLFTGEVLELWRASQARTDGAGLGLRLRLRLTDVPELAHWPWECLYDPLTDRFLALSSTAAIVRSLEAPGAILPFVAPAPLHLLVVAAAPHDLATLDIPRELALLAAGLEPLLVDGRIVQSVLESATLEMLQRRLRQEPVHLLHFIGHGRFDVAHGQGLLAFQQQDGAARWVTERQFSNLLADHRSLRLVVLNACEGSRTELGDAFGGVAQALMRRRIPAVLAMAHPISDDAALQLAGQFYAALADLYPVEAAVAEARKAIYYAGHGVEWATPVLHMRSGDGRLFSPPATAPTATTPVDAASPAPRPESRNAGGVILDIDNSTIDSSSFNINIGGTREDGD